MNHKHLFHVGSSWPAITWKNVPHRYFTLCSANIDAVQIFACSTSLLANALSSVSRYGSNYPDSTWSAVVLKPLILTCHIPLDVVSTSVSGPNQKRSLSRSITCRYEVCVIIRRRKSGQTILFMGISYACMRCISVLWDLFSFPNVFSLCTKWILEIRFWGVVNVCRIRSDWNRLNSFDWMPFLWMRTCTVPTLWLFTMYWCLCYWDDWYCLSCG